MFALAPIHCSSVFRNRSPRQLVGGIANVQSRNQAALAKRRKTEKTSLKNHVAIAQIGLVPCKEKKARSYIIISMTPIILKGTDVPRRRLEPKDAVSIILSAGLLIATIYFATSNNNLSQQNTEMTRKNLELQNQLYNFPSVIVAHDVEYSLFNSSEYSLSDARFTFYGYVRADIKVVTPHFGSLSVELKGLSLREDDPVGPYINPERLNQTDFSYVRDSYVDLVNQGLNQFQPSLHLKVSVYLNPDNLPSLGETVQLGNVGTMSLEAKFFDFQTNMTVAKQFDAYITLVVKGSSLF
jgi:hypothetical protein